MKKKKESYFWASYSDLMTSLFFVMLVLFVLTILLLQMRINATENQLKKIQEIEESTRKIDPLYFEYDSIHRKHILKIPVQFKKASADINNIDSITQSGLKKAGESIRQLIAENKKKGIQYLLIIEGQASKDRYSRNYELSYERALALKVFWENNNVAFGDNCEVLISGSGDGQLSGTDVMREEDEEKNQRFLIHIVPKHGQISTHK